MVGTYCCWALVIRLLNLIQSSFTGVSTDVTRSSIPFFMASLRQSMSALFQQGIVLWVGLIFADGTEYRWSRVFIMYYVLCYECDY